MLNLAETFFLLTFDEKVRSIPAAGVPQCGLGGAVLADLALLGRISLREKKVYIVNAMSTGDGILDAALASLARASRSQQRRSQSLAHWLGALGGGRHRRRIARSLMAKGALRRESKRFLGVIPYAAYRRQEPRVARRLKRDLRAIVLAGESPEPRQVALLNLLKACLMLSRVFQKGERELAARRIEELAEQEAIGSAIARAVKEIQAANDASSMMAASGQSG